MSTAGVPTIVTGVDFVSVPTRDPARALAFYRDVLGLPESEYGEGEVEAPNVTLGFWAVKDPDGNVVILHRRYAPRVRRDQS